MIWKNFNTLYIIQCLDEIMESLQVLILVTALRNEYVTDPDWFLDIRQITCKLKNILVALSRENLMLLIINVFNVKHQHICVFQQLLQFTKEWFFLCKYSSACINIGMNSLFFRLLEKINQEIHLHQRFSTADCDTTFIFPVAFIAKCCFKQFVCCLQFAVLHLPCVRVVAELAAHWTSAYKNNKAYARSVNGTEAFC